MNYKKIAENLVKEKFADEGMIAWGKRGRDEEYFGTGVEGANSWRYAVTKAGENLAFIPFSRSGIYFKNAYVIEKSRIKDLRVCGKLWRTNLELTTADDHVREYHIFKGKKSLEKIVKALKN